ncbi:hypothetical protein [Psychrobacter aestuarii]|uniref:PH domain-containing protein n=1 Tax=Psychrobacter aestuarii TaxID=556327 RepID=A0ABP3FCK0_9GAMM|nr:hypothetical protein [Psychrobacter aestuarii]
MDTELLNKVPEQAAYREEEIIKQYEYRPAKWYGVFCLVPSLALCWTAVQDALNNEAGVILNHISLSPNMAIYFAWGSALLFFMVACFGLTLLIQSFQKPHSITLYDSKIIAPKRPISNKLMTVRYQDIHKFEVTAVGKLHQIIIHTTMEKVVISDMNFADKSLFIEMLHTLMYKVPSRSLEV